MSCDFRCIDKGNEFLGIELCEDCPITKQCTICDKEAVIFEDDNQECNKCLAGILEAEMNQGESDE